MGICCSKKQDGEERIRLQIEKTIVEQQKIKEQEVQEQEEEEQQIIQIQCLSQNGRSPSNPANLAENYNLITQPGNDEVYEKEEQPKQEKTIKKKKTELIKEDLNYFKKSDHVLGIKSLVVELQTEGSMKYYKISILVNSKDMLYNVTLFGTLTTQNDFNYFSLKPKSFEEASKYSRFYTFFSNDNYFNADRECKNNFNAFDKLLYVERSLQVTKRNLHRLTNRQSVVLKEKSKLVNSVNSEMLEIISVVDIEQQSRFLTVLFHLLLQQYHKKLEQYLVFITSATFLFERPPQFDQPNVYRMGLFYDKLDYSLKDLQALFQEREMELSSLLHKKLSLNLIQILFYCYSNYLYRLNFTLNSIFYVSKFKQFKLECFGRAKSLIPFGQNLDAVKSIEEKKMNLFFRAFKKDFYAVCDLIVFFKKTNGVTMKQISSKRRKFIHRLAQGEDMADDENNYLVFVDSLFEDTEDRYIIEFIRLGVYAHQLQSMEKTLTECSPIIDALQKQINQVENKIELEPQQVNVDNSIDQEDEENNANLLETFQLDFNTDYPSCSLNPDKLKKSETTYKELLYQSLLFEDQFYDVYQLFRSQEKSKLQESYIEILYSFYLIKQMNEDSWQYKLDQVSDMMAKPIDIVNTIYEDTTDHFQINVLFYILTLSNRKPIPLLNSLQRCINKQLEWKISTDRKFRSHNSPKGLIEQKKHIMLQLMFAQSYLNNHNYFLAVHKIQRVIGFQLKNAHVASLFYGYSLLVSGEIQRESLQPVSAMLNLEMSQVIYNTFFPEYKTVEEIPDEKEKPMQADGQKFQQIKVQNLATNNKSKLELMLGMSYFDIHDQENSLKCLRLAQNLLLRSYNLFADEVIAVVIKQLELFMLQDDIGSAMKIALEYSFQMNKYYREGRSFKRKIISKLQFIMSNLFEFSGQLLSSIRYLERSNKTFTNSKGNNFIIQMHFQTKKLSLIQKVKEVFIKIKNKQTIRQGQELSLYLTLSEHMSQTFLSQFYKQRVVLKSSLLFDKYGSKLIKVQVLIKYGYIKKVTKFLQKFLKILNKNKKDELYAILSDKLTFLDYINKKVNDQIHLVSEQIEINERYLQFPSRESNLLKCLIILFFLYGKTNNSKLIQDTYQRIQLIIDNFYETLQWKTVSSKQNMSQMNNKFEIIITKNKVSMLYQIQAIVETIEYFNTLKKQIFNTMYDGKELFEVSTCLLKEFEQFQTKLNFNLHSNKQLCAFGHIPSLSTLNEPKIAKQERKVQKNQVSLSSNLLEQNKLDTDPTPQSTSKIVLDVRSYEEIMFSKRNTKQQVTMSKEQHLKIIEETKKSNIFNKQRTENSQGSNQNKMKSSYKINPFQSTLKKMKQ